MSYLWDNPFVNFVKFFVSTIYKGIVWFFNLFIQRDDIAIETTGEQFKQLLDERLAALNLAGQFNVQFFNRQFHELCQESRREKKPILIVMLRDHSDDTV